MPCFNIGDVLAPTGNTVLRSGCSLYGAAVVILADPLIVTSVEGDMKWSNTDGMEFTFACKHDPAKVKKLQRRLYDDLPTWVNHKFIVSVLRDLYDTCATSYDRRESVFAYHGRRFLGCALSRRYRTMLLNFITIESLAIPEDEVSAPFQHDWGRRQHWLNAVLRRLRLPPIEVKIPKSYVRKWGDILTVKDNRIVATGKISHSSPFAAYWASRGYEVTIKS